MNECIISIGSNIDAESNISKMLEILKTKVDVLQISSFINTKPIGITNQADFTNGAVKIRTHFDMDSLTRELKKIEDDLERDRTAPKYGPRTIDLDIIIWNGKIMDQDYYERDFIRQSVKEIT